MKWVQKHKGIIVEVICYMFILLFVYAAGTDPIKIGYASSESCFAMLTTDQVWIYLEEVKGKFQLIIYPAK